MRKMVNGTAVAVDGKAVLLTGVPGCGKSDLALRLIDGSALLIADDLVELRRAGDHVQAGFPADAPADLRGRIEARGLGIVSVPAAGGPVRLALVVESSAGGAGDHENHQETQWFDVSVPVLRLALLEASAPAKVRLALGAAPGSIIRPS